MRLLLILLILIIGFDSYSLDNDSILFDISQNSIMNGNFNTADSCIDLIIDNSKYSNNYYNLSKSYNYKGIIELQLGNQSEALIQFKESVRIAKKNNIYEYIAKSLGNIALIYYSLKDFSSAEMYLTESTKILKENFVDSSALDVNLSNLAMALMEQNKWGKVRDIIFKEKLLTYGNHQHNNNIIGSYYYYKEEQNIDSSLYYFKVALTKENTYSKTHIHHLYNNIGIIYSEKKQFDSSILYLTKSFDISSKINDEFMIYTTAKKLSLDYGSTNKNDSVKKYSEISNSFDNNFDAEEYKKVLLLDIDSQIKSRPVIGIYRYVILSVIMIFILILLFIWSRSDKSMIKKEKIESKIKNKKTPTLPENINQKLKEYFTSFEIDMLFLNSQIKISVISHETEINTSYISAYINHNFDKTFSQYLTELRINYIIERYITDEKIRNYSIDALAKEAGYNSSKSFTDSFKRTHNATPIKFLQDSFSKV